MGGVRMLRAVRTARTEFFPTDWDLCLKFPFRHKVNCILHF
jgi:hypothetical protein